MHASSEIESDNGGCRNREKAAFTPKLQAVNCERRDLWRGEWLLSFPLYLLSVSAHAGGDNMAATGRNLLLESRIKDTEADRNLLSNTQMVDANTETQKCELLFGFIHFQTHVDDAAETTNEAGLEEGNSTNTLCAACEFDSFNKVIIWM